MIEIVKTYEKEVPHQQFVYIEDLNVCLKKYRDRLSVIDLENAMKPGKTCIKYSLVSKRTNDFEWSGNFIVRYLLESMSIEEFVDNLKQGTLEVPQKLDFYTYEMKSVRTFSPFVKTKEQDLDKLTVAKLPKAILAGQIEDVECAGYYTDDYLRDYANNYSIGVKKDKMELAMELVEDGTQGWFLSKRVDGVLSLHCYSFLSYVLKVA